MEWQPIETAPKGEDTVLVFDGQFVDVGTSISSGSKTYFCFISGKEKEVTLWAPLPAAPEYKE